MRKIISVILALCIMSGSVWADDSEEPSPWAKNIIERGLRIGLINPKLNYNYRSYISRQDFCKLIISAYMKENNVLSIEDLIALKFKQNIVSYPHKFKDLDYSNPDYKYVVAANLLGIVKGSSNDTFSPEDKLTREQSAKILSSFYQKLIEERGLQFQIPFSIKTFNDDSKISQWAKYDVYIIKSLGIMSGVGDNTFNPKGTYTVEQAMVSLSKLYDSYLVVLQSSAPMNNQYNSYKQELLILVNEERAKHGLNPLKECTKYNYYADIRAGEIIVNFDHKRPDGTNFFSGIPDYSAVGENIGAGQKTPKEVFNDWMNSPHHKENIINPAFEEMAVGVAQDKNTAYGLYWVQFFYSPLR